MRGISRRAIVAANWKMHGSRTLVDAFVTGLRRAQIPADVDVVVMPPAVYLAELAAGLEATAASAGAQNLHPSVEGALTGEISGEMLFEAGARWVLTGHSERRQGFGESDPDVAARFAAALRAGLTPVLCVGETLDVRDAGRALEVVAAQVQYVLEAVGSASFAHGAVAYEPVWAIGTGRTATAEQAQAMHAHLRTVVAATDPDMARGLRILYGGSVQPGNAAELFGAPDVDGGLIGGAGLVLDSFLAVVDAARAPRN